MSFPSCSLGHYLVYLVFHICFPNNFGFGSFPYLIWTDSVSTLCCFVCSVEQYCFYIVLWSLIHMRCAHERFIHWRGVVAISRGPKICCPLHLKWVRFTLLPSKEMESINHHIVSAHHPRPMSHGGLQSLSISNDDFAQTNIAAFQARQVDMIMALRESSKSSFGQILHGGSLGGVSLTCSISGIYI